MTISHTIFWLSLFGIFYAYIGYPFTLKFLTIFKKKLKTTNETQKYQPSVSIIIPVHNEEKVIKEKIENIISLEYPKDKIEVIIVSDGSTDNTKTIVLSTNDSRIKFFDLTKRSGKAAVLNLGLQKAGNEILIFTDVSIILESNAIQNIVSKFKIDRIGCISGEDHIREVGGEGFYGKYELFLRNLESEVYSIVGASGSFYAQRRFLCKPFIEGMAPDFLSVLNTIEEGYLAITEPTAIGEMTSVKKTKDEFQRKIRTLIRGMTALFHKKSLLNPFRYLLFSLELFSHKIMRWMVPLFLIVLFIANMFLMSNVYYLFILLVQIVFYLIAIVAFFKIKNIDQKLYGKIPLYFSIVNLAILIAWIKYLFGIRREIWNPSNR